MMTLYFAHYNFDRTIVARPNAGNGSQLRICYDISVAQWNGQYTGNTHSTKVADYESVLENAVRGFNTCAEELKPRKAKAIKKLAAKVLNARLKMIRAKLAETIPVESHKWESVRAQIEHLEMAETKLASEGVAGILREFGALGIADEI